MTAADMDPLLYHVYAGAVAHSTADQLAACPPMAPLPRQAAIVREVVRWAEAQGCRFPPKVIIQWVQGRAGICPGCIAVTPPYTITLDAMAYPLDLRRTVAHELRHLHDLHAGDCGFQTEERVASERRCDLFAEQCLKAFRWRL